MKLGLGTVQLGLDYGISNNKGKPIEEESFQILKYAFDNKINIFDTAPSYGGSEKLIGKFINLYELKNNVKICTKLKNINSDKKEILYDKSYLKEIISLSVKKSLESLSISEIEYYLLHNSNDLNVYKNDIFDCLTDYKNKGLIKKIGVSVYTPDDLYSCLDYSIDVIQIPFNVLDWRFIKSGYLMQAKEQGIEIHCRSIYLQGLLLMEEEDIPQNTFSSKVMESFNKYLKILKEIAYKEKMSIMELCYSYVRHNDLIDCFFVGCNSVLQIKKNLDLYNIKKINKSSLIILEEKFDNVDQTILNPSLWGKA